MAAINVIVSLSKNAGMGYDISTFPLEYFLRIETLTREGILIMGRHTWELLTEPQVKALNLELPSRQTVVVSTTQVFQGTGDLRIKFVSPKDIDVFLVNFHREVFILGGQSLYAMFMDRVQRIYVTIMDAPPNHSMQFPTRELQHFDIVHYNPSRTQNIIYERRMPHTTALCAHYEFAYLSLLTDIYKTGRARKDRTNVGTVAVFGRQMRFDISKNVPLLTTKQLGWKSVIRELLWFLQGKTDSKLLEEHKVNIWKDNSTREFLDKRGLTEYAPGDIGPMYGFQWRHMGAEYKGAAHDYTAPEHQGHDQIKWLLNSLRTDPYSRRHMITTYNPLQVDQGVLAPCHGIVAQFFVEEPTNEPNADASADASTDANSNKPWLSCHVYNRSQDTFLGMSWNIFSYAALTYIIAKFTNMRPKELIISTGDTHIYSNHMEQCAEQIKRTPLPFPILTLKDQVTERPEGIDGLTLEDFDLIGYLSHPPIRAPMAV